MFNDLELTHGSIENIISASPISSVGSSDDLLEVYPLELRFPLERSKRKDNAASECSVTLTNRTDDYVGVWITPINSDTRSSLVFPYMWEEPCYNNGTLFRGLRPHTSLCVNMAMKKKHEQLPLLQEETDMLFQVTMIPAESEKALKRLESDLVNGTDVLKYVATKIYWTTLRAVTYDPEKCQDTVTNQMFIREIPDFGDISSIDVHPTETWVLVGHKTGHVSIWNYETKWRVNMFKVTSYYHISSFPVFHKHVIHSTKFIVGEQWFAAMDGNGSVHIYDYTTNKKMMEFQAHYCPTPGVLPIIVMLLAVHPTEPLLLTAHHKTIKLWDWSQEWACTRTFDAGDDGLLMSLEFGPRDTYTFVSGVLCKGGGHVVKAWDIHSSDPAATLHGGVEHTFYTDSHQHFLVTTTIAYGAKVWDLQTKKCVHQLYEKSSPNLVACHPTLPVLATVMKNDSRLGFWDTRTYRHMKSVELYLEGSIISMVFNGSEDITRLVVASDKEISVIKINMPAIVGYHGHTNARCELAAQKSTQQMHFICGVQRYHIYETIVKKKGNP
ncbi:unnamed protein product [Urochloa decumbens]|uniref:Uncharacterized protein n=1 Tax=Urochloa decumbens TaxID=240449 RepID=A0ABC9AUX7_9POAL